MGNITNHLIKQREQGRLAKPSLHVSFMPMGPMGDDKFMREDYKRCKSELKAMQDEVDNWDPEAIAAQALKSLKTEIAVKKARLEEMKARMGKSSDEPKAKKSMDMEMDEEPEEESEDEEEE